MQSETRYFEHELLPIELQDIIIQILIDDGNSLLTASLVCSYWRLRSYSLAFRSINLNQYSIFAFKSFLHTPFSRSTIFPQVRHVSVSGPSFAWVPDGIVALKEAVTHLASMDRVLSLSLCNMNWGQLAPQLVSPLSKLQRLHTLDMNSISFTHRDELSELLGGFSSLRRLGFQDLHFPHIRDHRDVDILERSGDGLGSGSLVLRAHERSLRKLLNCTSIRMGSPETSAALAHLGAQTCATSNTADLLRTLGPSLNSLEIISTLDVFSDAVIGSLDISHNTSLAELSLISPDRVFGMISWLPKILRKAPSSLQTLRVAFASSRQFYLDRPFLLHVVGFLDHRRFPHLHAVHFVVVKGRSDTAELEQTIVQEIRSAFAQVQSTWVQNDANVVKFTFIRNK